VEFGVRFCNKRKNIPSIWVNMMEYFLSITLLGTNEMDRGFIIPCVIWLGGGNAVVLLSLHRQKIPWYYFFIPTVLAKLQGRDWAILFVLGVLSLTSAAMLNKYWPGL
jgi:hypothetical protein